MVRVTMYEPYGRGRIRLGFDNGMEFSAYAGEAGRAGITLDAEVAEEALDRLVGEIGMRARRRAMHLMERMDRTEHQLREKLAQGDYPRACVDDAVAYLYSFHYLDDFRYACNFVYHNKERYSRRQLCLKLTHRGVAKEQIDRALEEEYDGDECEQICRLLRKRHFVPGCDAKDFARTCRYLLGRGFGSEAVLRTMRNFEAFDGA